VKKQIKDLELYEIDFLIAKVEGFEIKITKEDTDSIIWVLGDNRWIVYSPTTNHSQAWPIIESERINIRHLDVMEKWLADIDGNEACGKTSLEAAMRAFVVSKFGYDVDIYNLINK
jgi:hypothetical protein